uniref:Uncharacterized protein n=1 Tax=Cacopsylla melanoneura TaxID=428564 RepID=A0A8D8QQ34_9HEMI
MEESWHHTIQTYLVPVWICRLQVARLKLGTSKLYNDLRMRLMRSLDSPPTNVAACKVFFTRKLALTLLRNANSIISCFHTMFFQPRTKFKALEVSGDTLNT